MSCCQVEGAKREAKGKEPHVPWAPQIIQNAVIIVRQKKVIWTQAAPQNN